MEKSLEELTISTLLTNPDEIPLILPKFSSLKTNFENYCLWLRYGLALSISSKPKMALQAFYECLRIDLHDPLPAMLAAKLLLDDPEEGLRMAKNAIERCKLSSSYKNIAPLLAKSYLLAHVMSTLINEREANPYYLNLANETQTSNYLVHFHKALSEAKQKLHKPAIDSVRRAIELNPYHIPSIQLMILLLSALKKYDEALNLCESTIHELGDDLLLLRIKCNLEQCLAQKKGYKPALDTAQLMLRRLRKSCLAKQTTNLFAQESNDEVSIWVLVAEIFIKIGSLDDAELCADESAIHADGALSLEIMLVRGLIAKAKNNLIEAKSFFQSCLALCPKHPIALQQIAHVHYLLGNYSTAEKFLKDSLDIDSDCHKTWRYLSLVFIEMNQHEKANECIKKATILEESSPVIPISAISTLTLE